jgi:hypothetical protein
LGIFRESTGDEIKYFLGAETIQLLIGWLINAYLTSPSSSDDGEASLGESIGVASAGIFKKSQKVAKYDKSGSSRSTALPNMTMQVRLALHDG